MHDGIDWPAYFRQLSDADLATLAGKPSHSEAERAALQGELARRLVARPPSTPPRTGAPAPAGPPTRPSASAPLRHALSSRMALSILGLLAVGMCMVLLADGTRGPDEVGTPATERCLPVSPQKAATFAGGLNVGTPARLLNARAVRSTAYRSLYFVSAEIDAPGLRRPGDIATWATNRLEPDQGMYFAVSPLAISSSVWPDLSRTDAGGSMADDGARESVECVRLVQP